MISAMMGSDELQKTEFEIDGKQFEVKKLMPLHAYKVFMEHVRPCFGAIKGVDMAKPEALLEVFAAIEYKNIEAMTAEFIRHCIYTRNDGGQMVKITVDPDGLTQGMDPAHLTILTLRAFAINFGSFYSKFATEIMKVVEGLGIEPDPSQPTPSSTQESEQDSTHSLI